MSSMEKLKRLPAVILSIFMPSKNLTLLGRKIDYWLPWPNGLALETKRFIMKLDLLPP